MWTPDRCFQAVNPAETLRGGGSCLWQHNICGSDEHKCVVILQNIRESIRRRWGGPLVEKWMAEFATLMLHSSPPEKFLVKSLKTVITVWYAFKWFRSEIKCTRWEISYYLLFCFFAHADQWVNDVTLIVLFWIFIYFIKINFELEP